MGKVFANLFTFYYSELDQVSYLLWEEVGKVVFYVGGTSPYELGWCTLNNLEKNRHPWREVLVLGDYYGDVLSPEGNKSKVSVLNIRDVGI